MRKKIIPIISIGILLAFTSCKSTITSQKVLKQEDKAMDEVQEAQEELIILARMKEQYSVDGVQEELKDLRNKKEKLDRDISKIEEVSTDAAQSGTKTVVADLRNRSNEIAQKIETLEAKPKENWAQARENINYSILALEKEIQKITANIDRSDE